MTGGSVAGTVPAMAKTADTGALRAHAEDAFAEELQRLAVADDRPRPPGWRLSPWAVATYVLGGEIAGRPIQPKYLGDRRPIEVAIATLATDRALLLQGLPGTAKSWVSEHLAAAISGSSTLLVQGTAGLGEDALRYGWNYAKLIAEGPSEAALVPSPIMVGMREGRLVRIEELTRMPADVQDALITVLSEKVLPVPEIGLEVAGRRGFNVIATANDRDKGVSELSSALRRRFNTVVLPLPESAELETEIVTRRVAEIGRALELPVAPPAVEEIRRVVVLFRELRAGRTEDGRTEVPMPSGTLSTAELIDVVSSGMALAGHFGDGEVAPSDLASGLLGAVVREARRDEAALRTYLDTVARARDGWGPLREALLGALSDDREG